MKNEISSEELTKMENRINENVNQKTENCKSELRQDMSKMENRINENVNQKIENCKSELRQDMSKMENRINENVNQKIENCKSELRQDMSKIENRIIKEIRKLNGSIAVIEVEHSKKIDILYENVVDFLNKTHKNESNIEKLNKRVEKLEYKSNTI